MSCQLVFYNILRDSMLNDVDKLNISNKANIHKTAILVGNVTIEDDVFIGPYCIIEGNIKLCKGVRLLSHVVISGNTTIGEGTLIYHFASIGSSPQDLKYKNEETYTDIGKNNIIREYVTINPGTGHGGYYTKVGDDNLFMISSHVGHDSQIANNCVISNNVAIAGHVELEEGVIIGGNSAVHQFVRVGANAMIGGMSGVTSDILPFCIYVGNRENKVRNLNVIGLKRKGFSISDIKEIKATYEQIFRDSNFLENAKEMLKENSSEHVKLIINFILFDSSRKMCYWEKSQDIKIE